MFRIFFYRDGVKLWIIDYKNDAFGVVFSHSQRRGEATLHTKQEVSEIASHLNKRYGNCEWEAA